MPHQYFLSLHTTECNGGLGFEELFWGLQPCKVKVKACRRWGTWPFSQAGVSYKALSQAAHSRGSPAAQHLQGSPRTVHGASKSSGVSGCALLVPSRHENKCLLWNPAAESLCALTTWHGQRRDVSSGWKRFFQIALWKEVPYDGLLWKYFVHSELVSAL